MAIMYRTRYPVSRLNVEIDEDIQLHLEDKIIDLMLKSVLLSYHPLIAIALKGYHKEKKS